MRVAQKITEIGGRITAILLREKEEQKALELALKELGCSISVCRVYLFENIYLSDGDVITIQKCQWCAEGITPKTHNPDLQNFSLKRILPDVFQLLSFGQNINAIVSDLSEDFKTMLESEDIQSVLMVPILFDNVFWGFIGFDDCINKERWRDSEVDLLRLSANSIGLYLKIKREEREKLEKCKHFEFFMDAISSGIWDWNIRTGEVVFSESLAAMFGYTMEEWGAGPEAWSSRVHPDDLNTITPAIKNHLDGSTGYYQSEHRLLCKDGGYKWVLDRGKIVERDEHGKAIRMMGMYTDIQSIKGNPNNISESENNFRQFYNRVNDLGFIIDSQGMIVDVNQRALEVLGYKKDELEGKNLLIFHPENQRAEAQSIFADMLAGKASMCPIPLLTKTNQILPVETHFVKGKWDGKDVFFGTSRDLSKLVETREIFLKAFHRNPEPMALLSKSWRFIDTNEAFQRALGFTMDELKDRSLSEVPLFIAESQQFILENEFSSSGFIRDLEINVKTKSGIVKQVLLRVDTIKRANTDLIMLVFTDITELRSMHSQLQDAHAQLENFFRAFDDMVFVFDTEKRQFTYVNNGAEKIFGRRIPVNDDISFLANFLSLEDRQHLRDNLSSIINGNILKGELKLQFPDGSVKWLLYKLWPRLGEGKQILEGMCSDVTATKQIVESTQRALVKEKELSELKSIFISTASHEFRTPLATILSSVDIMESYDKNLTPQKKAQHYAKIKKSVKQMTSMLNEILTLSKKELSQIQVRKENVNLVRLIHQIREDIEASNQANGVQIELVNKTGDETFSLDPKLMKSMLINLLLNAVKYSYPGSPVLVTIFKSKQNLVIEISDKGIGISQSDLQSIYKPFFRGKNVGDRPGTGLGMAIIKEGIDALNGTIHIASHIGTGTTVTLKIPIYPNSIV